MAGRDSGIGMLAWRVAREVSAEPLSLKLSDTRVYEPQMRARLGTTSPACQSTPDCGMRQSWGELVQGLLGPVDHSFRALSGRLEFTDRRHKFNKILSFFRVEGFSPFSGWRVKDSLLFQGAG